MDKENSKNFLEKIRYIHKRFVMSVHTSYKDYADKIKEIMKEVEKRKIEKLSAEIKSHKND